MISSCSRRPRRAPSVGAALVCAAVVCAAGAVVVSACSAGSAARGVAGTSGPPQAFYTVSAQAPTTALPSGVLASVPVTSRMAPTGMVAAHGALWVEGHRGSTVDRIDPDTDRVTATVTTGQNGCGVPVAVDDEVWIQPCGDSSTTPVIDARTATIRGTIKDAGGANIAVADGSVWEASYEATHVLRIDPSTLKVTARIAAASGLVVYGDGMIWSTGINPDSGNGSGELTEIDPHSNRVVATFTIPTMHDPYGVFAYGKIWIKSDDHATLVRFDPRTHQSTATNLPGWASLYDYSDQVIDAAAGSLWIRINPEHVARIDPSTERVTATYPAQEGSPGGSPLVAFGSLWVSNFDSDTVWRDRLSR